MNPVWASTQILFQFVVPVSVFVVVLIAGALARGMIFRRLERWAGRTRSDIDDILVEAVERPFLLWCLMLGVFFALASSNLPTDIVRISDKILLVLGILSVTFVLANISARLLKRYADRIAPFLPLVSLTEAISRILIYGIGILVLLNSLGIAITPILATLGIGSLAVALALQDTLSNLFAGFHVSMARQIRIGDYVKLETGEEGYVTDINWRTTQIKVLPNNIVLVPNAKLAQAIVTNYYLPDKELAVLVNMGVHYKSDLKEVERVVCEVARQVMKEVPGGVPEFEPFIRYHTFGDFSINFTVILRAKEFVGQYLVKHEFIKKLHERFAGEGIVIPYPIRAINHDQEKNAAG